jgi:hypothetical protein
LKLVQVEERERRVVLQQRVVGLRRELEVPGADILAHIAAEHPITHQRCNGWIDLAAVLDRQVGDAPATVEHARFGEGARGTGVEAACAAAAAIRLEGRVQSELEVGEHACKEEERPAPRVDQHGVLPDPAEARTLGKLPLRYGPGIDVGLGKRVVVPE